MVMASIKVQQEEQVQVLLLLQAWLLLPRLTRRGTGRTASIALVATLTNNKKHKKNNAREKHTTSWSHMIYTLVGLTKIFVQDAAQSGVARGASAREQGETLASH